MSMIQKVKSKVRKFIPIKTFEEVLNDDSYFKESYQKFQSEFNKTPSRTEIINFLFDNCFKRDTKYLEIGVRNPNDNFNQIRCKEKYSVDPGVEFKENPVDFKLTSDDFFNELREGKVLNKDMKFDVIFIDGLHLADQVERDIQNSLGFIKDDGFIVIHDCNPPAEFFAREEHNFRLSPARNTWNGTVWKAFYKMRFNKGVSCVCIDTDWGVGIITKKKIAKELTKDINPFFEYHVFNKNRKEHLNLIDFDNFKSLL